jgi:hypothetical protein
MCTIGDPLTARSMINHGLGVEELYGKRTSLLREWSSIDENA